MRAGAASAPCALDALRESTPSKRIRPRVGVYSPTSIRATVDLPQPDSPTRANVSPRADLEGHAVDRVQQLRAACRSSTRFEPGRGDVEDPRARRLAERSMQRVERHAAGRPADRSVRGCHRVALAYGRRASCSQQPPARRSARARAARSRQRSNACGQRGLNAQPGGIATGRGIAPSICARRARVLAERRDRAHQARGVGMLRPRG